MTNSSPFDRNRDPILEKLSPLIPADAHILEIGSGRGDHIQYFADQLPGRCWQPTEREENFATLSALLSDKAPCGIAAPILADLYDEAWAEAFPKNYFDLLLAINVIHIAAWEATSKLMRGASALLKPNGRLLLYGPYRYENKPLEPSNATFNEWLKKTYPGGGLRVMEDVVALAEQEGLDFVVDHDMPANNHVIIFQKS